MMARSAAQSSAFSHGSLTLTLEEPSSSSPLQQQPQYLVVRLKPPKKKEKPSDEDDSDVEDRYGSNFCNGPSNGSGECPSSHGGGSHAN
ncbi:hypothetical protein HPP92_017173 [Vanilla planifolia]|uniref:Uncharacterized protein n=1 Tax=Vanilla planifolia TaxID=51239 RepID=A0A835UPD6_VANPL|nr:hypothetical protein HPP92_017173 [Vanilla planifolia]